MDQYLPLLTGLAGALIGGASAIAAIFIQAHYKTKETESVSVWKWRSKISN